MRQSNSVGIFDPTWFKAGKALNKDLLDKLFIQLKYKPDVAIQRLSLAYQQYLELGGEILFRNISVGLLFYLKED